MNAPTTLLAAVALASACVPARDAQFARAPYMDPSRTPEARAADLVSRMTMAEKVAQLCTTSGFKMYEIRDGEVYPAKALDDLYARFPGCGLGSFFRADWYSGRNWQTGLTPDLLIKAHNAMQRYAVEKTRLGVPLELDGAQMLGETGIPSGLACASSWDLDAIDACTRMRFAERITFAREAGVDHPTADLALDPRWSRVEQTFGEDPFLSAEINFRRSQTMKALGGSFGLAHFVCHGAGEGGRMSLPVHVGDNELYNLHMRPFEYAVRGGGVTSIMTCYNLVDGIPGILRGDLVDGFIRGRLGYKGLFIGDAGAIGGLVWQGFARDLGEAAALCVENGNDLCCWEAENYLKGLTMAVARGQIREEAIDAKVRKVLEPRFRKGLFENPYVDAAWTARHGRPEDVIGCRAHRDAVLNLARKAMTLLENPKGVLPLDPAKIRTLAVIGPNADKPENQMGDYSAPQQPGQAVTPRMGFEALGRRFGFAVKYALGCKVRAMRRDGFAEALAAARAADAVVLCLGGSSVPDQALTQNEAGSAICRRIERDTELDKDAGEGFDRATLRLGGVQRELLAEIKKLGKPVVTVLIVGRPLVLDEVKAHSDAVLLAWYPGTEGGTAVAETVFGLNNPGGKLPISFPRAEGALPCFYHALRARGNYVDCEGTAAYPFGYGLSYTTFDVSKPALKGNVVTVRVTNTGTVAGDDVVQMYLRDDIFTVARPRWALKGFRRVTLAPGETREVSFALTAKELGFWNRARAYVVEPGTFKVAVWDRFDDDGLYARHVTYTHAGEGR